MTNRLRDYADNDQGFYAWLLKVNRHVLEATDSEMEILDLSDTDLRGAYDAGEDPFTAAAEAIAGDAE